MEALLNTLVTIFAMKIACNIKELLTKIFKKTFILLKNWNKWAHSLNTLTGSSFGNTASP